jgi:DNA-binding NarL/FixJ family response regulator
MSGLVGRDEERGLLEQALAARPSLLLISGEAGTGKTRLVEEAAAEVALLRGVCSDRARSAYGPVLVALRAWLRENPDGFAPLGSLRGPLSCLLPEAGGDPLEVDRGTLVEALRAALAATGDAVLFLDDLQWSDEATLELLAELAPDPPLPIVAAYRSDDAGRGHPIRRLRTELRRRGGVTELAIGGLGPDDTAQLVAGILGAPPDPELAAAIHERTQGLPFFVVELATVLRDRESEDDDSLPLPETIRDAVLLRVAGLSAAARAAAEVAAVAGARFDLDVVAAIESGDGLAELLACGLVVERTPPEAAFRHALEREALYEDVPWLRRRALHSRLADELTVRDAGSMVVAAHRLAARELPQARIFLLQAVAELSAVHAYRDAARAGRLALDNWSAGEDVAQRLKALERHGHCAELAGDLPEAARAFRELSELRRSETAGRALADAERRLAGIYDLQGDRARARAAREVAATAYAAAKLPGEAAAERLVLGGYLQAAGDHDGAVATAATARTEARAAGRADLEARALGLEGVARAKRGEHDVGLDTVQAGLQLALANDLTAVAGDVYQRLGTVHEIAADYRGAQHALDTAIALCQTAGARAGEQGCVACLAYVLRELGDWERSVALCRELGAEEDVGPGTLVVTDGILGAIRVFRGELRPARRLLESSNTLAAQLNVVSMHVDSAAALGCLAALEGDTEAAAERCREVLERWEASQDRHYAVWPLRWAAAWLARAGQQREAAACAEALAQIASETNHPDVLAALGQALGELALVHGEADAAAEHLAGAVALHDRLDIPFDRAQIQLRAGVALAAIGDRDGAVERMTDAQNVARRLGARPLAAEAARELATLGVNGAATGPLSRRECEVVVLVAEGCTNREIASRLVVSTRTVDMHVRNILMKLDARSRAEAAAKAGRLGIC